MRIFNWAHRKFRQNQHDFAYGVKDSYDGLWPRILQENPLSSESSLGERGKRIRIPQEDEMKGCRRRDKNYSTVNEDTEALLGQGDNRVTELFSNWQNGLLTIGTFGMDQNDQEYSYETLDIEDLVFKETDEEELIDPIEVEVFEGKLEEVFGIKNEDYHVKSVKPQQRQNEEYSTSTLLHNESSGQDNSTSNNNNHHGNKIYPLQEFFEVPLLTGAVTKKENRTTLADLFSRSKNCTTSHMLDYAPKIESQSEFDEKKKKDESQGKSGKSFIKKVIKWKKGGELHRPKQWMMKMLNKKIYPEAASDLHANEVIGQLDISKTYINASKLKEMNGDNSCMDRNASFTNGGCELVSLLRDTSKGSQECWIKTDSEYVVLEL